MPNFHLLRFALLALLLLPINKALAALYCVTTITELRGALNNASASNEDDEIRLASGTYTFTLDSQYGLNGGLILSGSWNSTCVLRLGGAGASIITGSPARARILEFAPRTGDYLIDRITFTSLDGVIFGNAVTLGSLRGDMVIRRSRFTDSNRGPNVNLKEHNVRIENNLFANNDGTGINTGTNLRLVGSLSGPALNVDVLFNTFVGARVGLDFTGQENNAPRLQNNILTGATSADLYVSQTQLFASHNLIGTRTLVSGASLTTDLLNSTQAPQLNANFLPLNTSPAVNSGTSFVLDGLPSTDLVGSARVIGSLPDRGALETSVNDAASIAVTNTNDAGAGSLRQAIIAAESDPGFTTINFAIAGSCPHIIALSTALPSLQERSTIDGYSQAGSSVNESYSEFNGVVCVFLRGGNTLATGLSLQPNVGDIITVKGLGFYGFNQQAIRIDGSGEARVGGSLFGTGASVIGQNFANSVIRIVGTNGSIIGGTEPASHNVIGGGDVAGIVLAGGDRHLVSYNLIGQSPTGGPLPNGVGILIDAGDSHRIESNKLAYNNSNGIEINSTATPATRVLMGFNRIGVTSLAQVAPNQGDGIRIEAGSEHSMFRNSIQNNASDGIEILSSSRRNNGRRNSFLNNQALAIDLSPQGVNPVDLDVGQTGANDQQNAPQVVFASGGQAQAEVEVRFESDNGNFEIDFYGNNAGCQVNAAGRFQAQRYLVTVPVTLSCATAAANCTSIRKYVINNSEIGSDSLINLGITALARDQDGNISEVSNSCTLVINDGRIFRDGFE